MRTRSIFVLVASLALLLMLSTPPRHTHAQAADYIGAPFITYYWQYQGPRLLGLVHSALLQQEGYAVQYFEKGRLEDHRGDTLHPDWGLMYGRLTVEMIDKFPAYQINGTTVAYGDLVRYGYSRHAIPSGFTGGTLPVAGGTFVPADTELKPAVGYIIPPYFWDVINQRDLFPGGWLHDVGLPLTDPFEVVVAQQNSQARTITMQAFERTILTYDPLQTGEQQIERVNIGTDALLAAGQSPLKLEPARPSGSKHIEINLTTQRLSAFEGPLLIYDFPVSTGRDGFETPAGSFAVYSKYAVTDMQGSAGGETWYVPNVPHAMYFRTGGYAMHGTYWHNAFGTGLRLSHGCVNLPLDAAALLFEWTPLGTPVHIYY